MLQATLLHILLQERGLVHLSCIFHLKVKKGKKEPKWSLQCLPDCSLGSITVQHQHHFISLLRWKVLSTSSVARNRLPSWRNIQARGLGVPDHPIPWVSL